MGLVVFVFSLLMAAQAQVQEVKYGPWLKARHYDYRYVSTYTKQVISRPRKDFPWIAQDCHDESDQMAVWRETVTYQISYSGKISFKFLGVGPEFGADRMRSFHFGFERWVKATKGLRAKHTLYEEFDELDGVTQKEIRYADGASEIIAINEPFNFSGSNYGLVVKREILEYCQL